MDIQFILVIVAFAAALFYVGRLVYRNVSTKNDTCATGCGKCSADFSKISNSKS